MISAGLSACGSLIYASLLPPFRLPSANFGKSGEIVWRFPALYIGGVLKPLAKAALLIAGRALGAFVVGMIGGKLASAAGRMFGLEL